MESIEAKAVEAADVVKDEVEKLVTSPKAPQLEKPVASPLSLTMKIAPEHSSTKSSDSASQASPCDRVRVIQRRGNTYMVKGTSPPNDDPEELDNADNMISDLYHETITLSTTANNGANCFKVLYILETMFLVLAGALIGVLTVQGLESDAIKYLVTIIGFAITVVKTLTATFAIERKGVLLKDTSLKLRKISRLLRVLQVSDAAAKDKLKKLEDYYTEVDELDVNIFDNSASSAPATRRINAASVQRSGELTRPSKQTSESVAVHVDPE
jgi:hypothetical protein